MTETALFPMIYVCKHCERRTIFPSNCCAECTEAGKPDEETEE